MGKHGSKELSDTPKVTQAINGQKLGDPTLNQGAPPVATALKSLFEAHVEGTGLLRPKH